MDDCLFCKIVKGDIPSYRVYEDADFLGFLDINPHSLGHVLLIPKNHYRWVYDVPNFNQYWQVAQKIALNIKNSPLKPEYISFLTIGNEIPHAHIHILPRFESDDMTPVLQSLPQLKLSEEKFNAILNQIKL